MTTPAVTIAIPTYNRVRLLERAVDSALGQSFRDIELLVCDDGSADGTREFLAGIGDPRVRTVLHPENLGMSGNMDSGLRHARGDFFLMLSDDDYLEPDAVESLIEPWRRREGLSMSYGQWWYHKPGGPELQQADAPEIEDGTDYVREYLKGKRPTILHGVLFRTGALRRAGGIPPGYAQDTMMTLRMAFEGKVAHVPRPVTNYCLQPGSATHRVPLSEMIRDREMLLAMCLDLGAGKGMARGELRELAGFVRRGLSLDAAAGIVSRVECGGGRRAALAEALALRGHLARRPLLGVAALLLAAFAPRGVLRALRRMREPSR